MRRFLVWFLGKLGFEPKRKTVRVYVESMAIERSFGGTLYVAKITTVTKRPLYELTSHDASVEFDPAFFEVVLPWNAKNGGGK